MKNIYLWNPRVRRFKTNPLSMIPLKKKVNNFGDLLGPLIIRKICKSFTPNVKIKEVTCNHSYHKCLFSVGSVIHFAKNNDIIWGSGINGNTLDANKYSFENLDVRMVRGPKTKIFLEKMGIKCPNVFGDPALLFPYIFPAYLLKSILTPSKLKKVIFIPNLYDIKHFHCVPESIDVVNPRNKIKNILKKISCSSQVIATSLHAVILAESLGIPAKIVISQDHAAVAEFPVGGRYRRRRMKMLTSRLFRFFEDLRILDSLCYRTARDNLAHKNE